MAGADTARLLASLDLKDNLTPGINKAIGSIGKLETRLGRVGQGVGTIGRGIGTAIRNGALLAGVALTGLVALIGRSIAEGQEAAKVQAVYAKAIQNSGKVSADYVRVLDEQQTALMNLAGIDDELIKAEQTKLIQMGLTGKQVAALTPLVLDLSEATGKDLLTSALAVGKAANGSAGSLQKFGVFVDKAKFKVDPFAATMEALNQKFGGTTKALSGSLQARLGALRENLANIREEAGIKLLPAITRIVDVAGKDLVPAFGKFVDRIMPSLISGIEQFADMLEHGGAERGIKAITDALGPMVELLKLAAAPIKAIVGAFLSLPSQVQGVLIGAFAVNKLSGGLIGQGVGQIAGGLFQRGGSPANPLFVADVSGGLGGVGRAVGGAAAIGTGVAVAAIAAAVATTVISTLPFADKNNALATQGLNAAEIAAIKYYQSDTFSQQEALKHLGRAPTKADFDSGMAKIAAASRGLTGGMSLEDRSVRADAIRAGILARGKAAGFKPTGAAVEATLLRNIAREEQKVQAAIKAADGTSELVNIRRAVQTAGNKQPITNVKVDVHVTAAQVNKSVTVQRRFGPSGGSREHGPTEFD